MIYKNDLKKIIQDTKKIAFTNPEKATDEDTLGLIISNLCQYDGQKIFNVLYSAFEDSNFHSFNSKMEQTWNETERNNK
tara:strand:- start:384 stop:620 length:237 start_codon:yes stop_codon:yes gene_type:complete